MIKFEEAYNIVTKVVDKLPFETTTLEDSLGRILAEDVVSDMDMPPFDKSAMDGYACKYADINSPLEVIELIPAGKVPEKAISKNQCAKIMTGAIIPKGADCVLMIEHTEEIEEGIIKYTKKVKQLDICELNFKEKRQLNICYKGEDILKNDVVVKKGTLIRPQDTAIMASVGYVNVLVNKMPKVAVIPTGNEIVEPNIKPSVSEIRNSNGIQIVTQLKNLGIKAYYAGIARDTEKETMSLIEKAYNENDLVILTGGVSKGDFDLVPDILQKLNYELLFQEIAVQPGKPTVFGKRENKYCFALPGNPVSSFVQFELLIKPFIYNLMGRDYEPLNIKLPLANDFSRKKAGRKSFLPALINKKGEVELTEYNGSAHISGYSKVWGLVAVPMGINEIKKGELVDVRQI